jgi:hypothetical protein
MFVRRVIVQFDLARCRAAWPILRAIEVASEFDPCDLLPPPRLPHHVHPSAHPDCRRLARASIPRCLRIGRSTARHTACADVTRLFGSRLSGSQSDKRRADHSTSNKSVSLASAVPSKRLVRAPEKPELVLLVLRPHKLAPSVCHLCKRPGTEFLCYRLERVAGTNWPRGVVRDRIPEDHRNGVTLMSPSIRQRFLVAAVCSAAFAGPLVGHTETTPAPAASTAAPKSAPASAKTTHADNLQSTEDGATAWCRDGSYFHGNTNQHPCSDHGGVRKWLKGRGQDLLR